VYGTAGSTSRSTLRGDKSHTNPTQPSRRQLVTNSMELNPISASERDFSLFHVQTASGNHPASYPIEGNAVGA
jgi:hypothetical protein